jgi:hypothetical protein
MSLVFFFFFFFFFSGLVMFAASSFGTHDMGGKLYCMLEPVTPQKKKKKKTIENTWRSRFRAIVCAAFQSKKANGLPLLVQAMKRAIKYIYFRDHSENKQMTDTTKEKSLILFMRTCTMGQAFDHA